jgi:hypothetical protein
MKFFHRSDAKNAERFFLNNPVRGGIVQTSTGLWPISYPEGSEASQLPASHRQLRNFLLCALCGPAVNKAILEN